MNLKKIITNMSGYQPQTIRNNINDLRTFGLLAKTRRGKDAFYITTDNGRNFLEGKEIVQDVQNMGSEQPDQIMLTNFTKK
jgi:predicted transcriptional regulator